MTASSQANSIINETDDALQIIGGIRVVLRDYLSHSTVNSLKLEEKQITKLKDHKIESNKTEKMVIKVKTNGMYSSNDFYYLFYEYDNTLHKIFSEKTATKISNILKSKTLICLICLSILLYQIFGEITLISFGTLYHPIYSIFFSACLWMPYAIFLILSMNRMALRLTRKSFEIWFKVVVSITHFMAVWLDFFVLNADKFEYFHLALFERIFYGISFVLAIYIISCLDAIKIPYMYKVIMCGVPAFAAAYYSTWATILVSNNVKHQYFNYSIIHFTSNIALSLNSIQISTMRTLSIFLWRQCILSYIRKNNQTSMIKKTPYIVWNTNKDVLVDENDGGIDVTKDVLLQRLSINNEYTKFTIKEITQILGGINQIVNNYLNNDKNKKIEPQLNQKEINQIFKLINISSLEHSNYVTIYYFFEETDTFLHYLLNDKIADKIIGIFRNKISRILLCFGFVAYMLIQIMAGDTLLASILKILLYTLLFIPWSLYFILSSNSKGFLYVLCSFEFWLKTVYAAVYGIVFAIDNITIHSSGWNNTYFAAKIIEYITFVILIISAIAFIASLDAIHVHKYWKVVLLVSISFMGIMWTFYLGFISVSNRDRISGSVLYVNKYISFSLLLLQISSIRIITIFLMKQTFYTFKRNSATLIKYIPYLKWYSDDDINKSDNIVNGSIEKISVPSVPVEELEESNNEKTDKHHIKEENQKTMSGDTNVIDQSSSSELQLDDIQIEMRNIQMLNQYQSTHL